MLSDFGIVGGLSLALAFTGLVLTVYGVVARERPNGLSVAIVGLPIISLGVAILSVALLTPGVQ